jgi:hypothetical protein
MKNVKDFSLWMKVVVIVLVVLWCSPVLAGMIAEWDGSAAGEPTGLLTTSDGTNDYSISTGTADVITNDVISSGYISVGTTAAGDVGDINATGTLKINDVISSGYISATTVEGGTVTDGTATLTGGDLTGVDEITAATGNIMTVNSTDVTATGTVQTNDVISSGYISVGTTASGSDGDIIAGGNVTAGGDITTATGAVTGGTVQTTGGGVTLTDGTSGTTTIDGGMFQTNDVIASGYISVGTTVSGNVGDITAAGTVTATGADINSGNGESLIVNDDEVTMASPGGSVTASDTEVNMTSADNNTNVTVSDAGASMTDGTASVSTSGGAANMSSGGGDVTVTDTQASVTVNNGTATHGLVVGASNTTLSGGTDSTTLTLDDDGALLDNELDMDGNRITNVADGVNRYDAVNKGQLDEVAERAYQGIAAVAAMSAIPQPLSGHRFALGIGGGTYKDEGALAIGGSANLTNNIRLTGSVGVTSDSAVGAAGIGFSW